MTLNLTLPTIPSRSRLYHLEPIGLRTPCVESLTSYFTRLATAHSVSANSLYMFELQPIILNSGLIEPISKECKGKKVFLGAIARPINGSNDIAQTWVSTIESLTLRRHLCYLTTLLWRDAIAVERMLRSSPAWCPSCFKEWQQEGKIIYEPLLWMLAPITVCPSHRRKLIDICPFCNNSPHFLSGNKILGHCSYCGSWLGSADNEVDEPLSPDNQEKLKHELWCASVISEWIEVAQISVALPTKNSLREAIKYCIEITVGGNLSAFARLIGVNVQTVINWNSGRSKPWLRGLLIICSALKISLAQLLLFNTQTSTILSESTEVKKLRRETVMSRGRTRRYVQNTLITALQEIPSPTLRELADRMGYKGTEFFYRTYPELCRRISENYTSFMKEQNRKAPRKNNYDLKAVRQSLAEIQKQDYPPSIQQISRELNVSQTALRRRFAEICQKIIAKREELKKRRSIEIERDMKNALGEHPPPPLKHVLRRNGIGYSQIADKTFSQLCDAITTRFLKWKKAQHDELQFKLQSALNEYPPPSMMGLAKRTGYDRSTLNRRYPELNRAITARFAEYLKSFSERKRALLKLHIRRIVVELCEQDLYPSPARVTPLLEIQERKNSFAIGEILRELRRDLGIRRDKRYIYLHY